MALSDNERLIWAAAYAAEWSRQYGRKSEAGIKMNVSECVENAWAAVIEARHALAPVMVGWGEDDDVYTFLCQMVH